MFVLLGLLNVLGRRLSTSVERGAGAELQVYSPLSVRGGLYFESRFS